MRYRCGDNKGAGADWDLLGCQLKGMSRQGRLAPPFAESAFMTCALWKARKLCAGEKATRTFCSGDDFFFSSRETGRWENC